MYSTLKIQNFGPVREADLTIRDINILVGEQGAGKSAIAKMITIFNDPSFVLRLSHLNDKNATFQPLSIFHKYNIASYFSDKTNLTFVKPGYYAISCVNGKFELPELNRSDITLHNLGSLFIPAERSFVGLFSKNLLEKYAANEPVPESLVRFANLYEKAKENYGRYYVDFLGVEFILDGDREWIRLCNKNTTLAFEDASSGLQTVIPLLMVISYCLENHLFSSFQIEEPELNLFPTSQLEMLRWIVSHCLHFTLTTQSPYILRAINNMLFAGRLYENALTREQVTQLMDPQYYIHSDRLAAYSLGNMKAGEEYCSNLFDMKKGLMPPESLDAVMQEQTALFKQLFSLSLQTLRNNLIIPHD